MYLFVGDIHGQMGKELEEKLHNILEQQTPDIVFFLGDIVGTEWLDILQKKFYGVFNKMKTLKDSPDGVIFNETVKECLELKKCLIEIDNDFEVEYLTDWAKELGNYVHYGHFVSNLPLPIREALKIDLEKNAKTIIDLMSKFVDKGSEVVVIEGNWDARTPLDFRPTAECKALPVEERNFYFKKFLESCDNRIEYFDKIGQIDADDRIFILLPFDEAMNYQAGTLTNIPEKEVILVSHTQAEWSAVKGDAPMTAEGEKIEKNMKIILEDLKPDIVFHGHLHDPNLYYKLAIVDKEIKCFHLGMKKACIY